MHCLIGQFSLGCLQVPRGRVAHNYKSKSPRDSECRLLLHRFSSLPPSEYDYVSETSILMNTENQVRQSWAYTMRRRVRGCSGDTAATTLPSTELTWLPAPISLAAILPLRPRHMFQILLTVFPTAHLSPLIWPFFMAPALDRSNCTSWQGIPAQMSKAAPLTSHFLPF